MISSPLDKSEKIRLRFLGGCRQVGRSAVQVETDVNMVLDYGVKVEHREQENIYPSPPDKLVEVAVICHAHLDHSGFLPALFDHARPKVLGTRPTKALVELLIEDSMKLVEELPFRPESFKRALRSFYSIELGDTVTYGDTEIDFFDAGHITGSALALVRYANKRVLYTSDFNTQETNNHYGCKPPREAIGADALIIESTYSNRDHPDRKQNERNFYEEVRATYESGGQVLVPSFAVDRAQEVISILRKFDRKNQLPIYLDGMSGKATDIMMKHPEYIKDYKRFKKVMLSVERVQSQRQRQAVIRKPGVFVSTAGMLSGGPALYYVMRLNPRSKIFLPGYCVEGTNGWSLLNHGTMKIDDVEVRVSLPVKYYDFSAHTGRSDLFRFIRDINPETVFILHGDYCEEFAEELKLEGFDAIAPEQEQEFLI